MWRRLSARLERAIEPIDREARAERAAHGGGVQRAWLALVVAAFALVLMEYAGHPRLLGQAMGHLEKAGSPWARGLVDAYHARWGSLIDLGYWVGFRVLGFAVIPFLVIWFSFRERLRDHGLGYAGLRGHLPAYGALFLLVLPAILVAGTRPEFVTYYPFYRRAAESWVDFVSWEVLYALQFFALEVFFRGFLLSACRRSMGSLSIAVMMVPYCMLHFTKPALEVLAAIPAGIVLGVLAMRTGSIWGGVLLHVAVALTMDVMALLQSTGLPTRLWPITR